MLHNKRMRNYQSVLIMGGALMAGGMVLSQTSLAQQGGHGPRVNWAAGEKKTMEGVISDITCGAGKHKMADANACANACAKEGRYALVVGKTVYEIHGLPTHPAAADLVGKLAGGTAKEKVTGTVTENKINVDTVEAAS